VNLVCCRPAKDPDPVLEPLYPWEGTMHFYGTVAQVGPEDLRLYYACNVGGSGGVHKRDDAPHAGGTDGSSSTCVARSVDNGTTWTRPLMPFVSYKNWTMTNMVFTSHNGWFDSMLLLPAGMPAPPGIPNGTRFVMAFDDGTTDTTFRALQLAVSLDGFAFTVLTPPPPELGDSFADTSVSLNWDPVSSQFVAFGRDDDYPDQHPGKCCPTPLCCLGPCVSPNESFVSASTLDVSWIASLHFCDCALTRFVSWEAQGSHF
jgi:hypothetical protein